MADTKISELDSMGALDGTEVFVGVQTATKKVLLSVVSAYVVDTITGAATRTPATTDQLMGALADDTPKMFDLDAIATYMVDKGFTDAEDLGAVPLLTDDVCLARADDSKKCTTAQLATYVLSGTPDASDVLKASIRNISGITDLGASIAGTEHMLVCDGSDPKRATLAQVTTFVNEAFRAYFTGKGAATASDADILYVSESGADKTLALSALATYIETKVSAGIVDDVWDGAEVTPVATSVFVHQDSSVAKTTTGALLYTYIESELKTVGVATLVTGDHVLFVDATDGNPKRATAAALATYVTDTGTLAAAVVTPILTDHIVLNQGGTAKRALVSAMGTKLFDGTTAVSANMRGDVLTINGLTDFGGSIDGDEHMLVGDGATAKRATLDQIAVFTHADATSGLRKYIADTLGDVVTPITTDLLYMDQSGTAKSCTATVFASYALDEYFDNSDAATLLQGDLILVERSGTPLTSDISAINDYVAAAVQSLYDPQWDTVTTFTGVPDSTSRLLMSDTSLMEVGYPIKYTIGVTDYYGIVAAVSGSTHIDIRGASLSGTVLALWVGPPNRVVVERIKIPGNYLIPWEIPTAGDEYSGPTSDILALVGRQYIDWRHGPAKLVAMAVTQGTADGTAQPKFNVKVAGTAVLTQGAGNGIPVSGTPGTWTWSAVVGIDTAQYSIVTDDAIEILCTCDDTEDGQASDLSIELVFVLE